MGWTKENLIMQAFGQLGLIGDVFQVSAEQLQGALFSLDSMMGTWNGKGIRIGYPIPSAPNDSELKDDSNIDDSANEAVVMNLALRLAPTVGKEPGRTVFLAAKQGYDVLLAKAAIPERMRMPKTMPSGAGQKPWRGPSRPYIEDGPDELAAGSDGNIYIPDGTDGSGNGDGNG